MADKACNTGLDANKLADQARTRMLEYVSNTESVDTNEPISERELLAFAAFVNCATKRQFFLTALVEDTDKIDSMKKELKLRIKDPQALAAALDAISCLLSAATEAKTKKADFDVNVYRKAREAYLAVQQEKLNYDNAVEVVRLVFVNPEKDEKGRPVSKLDLAAIEMSFKDVKDPMAMMTAEFPKLEAKLTEGLKPQDAQPIHLALSAIQELYKQNPRDLDIHKLQGIIGKAESSLELQRIGTNRAERTKADREDAVKEAKLLATAVLLEEFCCLDEKVGDFLTEKGFTEAVKHFNKLEKLKSPFAQDEIDDIRARLEATKAGSGKAFDTFLVLYNDAKSDPDKLTYKTFRGPGYRNTTPEAPPENLQAPVSTKPSDGLAPWQPSSGTFGLRLRAGVGQNGLYPLQYDVGRGSAPQTATLSPFARNDFWAFIQGNYVLYNSNNYWTGTQIAVGGSVEPYNRMRRNELGTMLTDGWAPNQYYVAGLNLAGEKYGLDAWVGKFRYRPLNTYTWPAQDGFHYNGRPDGMHGLRIKNFTPVAGLNLGFVAAANLHMDKEGPHDPSGVVGAQASIGLTGGHTLHLGASYFAADKAPTDYAPPRGATVPLIADYEIKWKGGQANFEYLPVLGFKDSQYHTATNHTALAWIRDETGKFSTHVIAMGTAGKFWSQPVNADGSKGESQYLPRYQAHGIVVVDWNATKGNYPLGITTVGGFKAVNEQPGTVYVGQVGVNPWVDLAGLKVGPYFTFSGANQRSWQVSDYGIRQWNNGGIAPSRQYDVQGGIDAHFYITTPKDAGKTASAPE